VLGAIAKHDSVPAEVVALQTLNPHAFSHWARNIFYNEQVLARAVAGNYPAPLYRIVLFNNLPNSTRRAICRHLGVNLAKYFRLCLPFASGENPISLWSTEAISRLVL
jgi:hypothetical protein